MIISNSTAESSNVKKPQQPSEIVFISYIEKTARDKQEEKIKR